MIDPNNLLQQFLGGDIANKMQQAGGSAKQQLDGMGMGLVGYGGAAAASA